MHAGGRWTGRVYRSEEDVKVVCTADWLETSATAGYPGEFVYFPSHMLS